MGSVAYLPVLEPFISTFLEDAGQCVLFVVGNGASWLIELLTHPLPGESESS